MFYSVVFRESDIARFLEHPSSGAVLLGLVSRTRRRRLGSVGQRVLPGRDTDLQSASFHEK